MRLLTARFFVVQEHADAGSGLGLGSDTSRSTLCGIYLSSLDRGDQLSCRSQHLSSFPFLMDNLVAGMRLLKAEQMMCLRLNQGYISGVKKYNAVIAEGKKEAVNARKMSCAVRIRNGCGHDGRW